jgi:WD40 repeat protein
MGGGASSTASKSQRDAPSSGASANTRIFVSAVAQNSKDATRIQDLEAQVRDLKAQLSLPRAADSVYAECHKGIVNGMNRRNEKKLLQIFDHHKLKKDRGIPGKNISAALREAKAPVIPKGEKEVAEVMKQFARNGNQTLEFGEFLQVACAPDDLQMNRCSKEELFKIYCRHKLKESIPSENIIAALREADAPIVHKGQTEVAEVVKQFDGNGNQTLEFGEFQQVACAPDDLQMWFTEKQMPFAADVLRPLVNKLLSQDKSGQILDQLKALRLLSPSDIDHSAAAFCSVFPDILRALHQELNDSFVAQAKMADVTAAMEAQQKAAEEEARRTNTTSKFWGFYKLKCGSVTDFHKGLSGRVGMPQLNFRNAMRQEHCERAGCEVKFTTGNYKITTTPKNEWNYVVNGVAPPDTDMDHGRCIVPFQELHQKSEKDGLGLIEEEVIAIILYTGPMFQVYNAILRQYPEEDFKVFADNKFSTTIFVLVSAVQKLCRCTRIPEGMLLYRGIGGRADLPDIFFQPDDRGRSGYAEWAFLSTTADRDVALQYSGIKDGLPKAMVMVIETSSIDRGADIGQFSQYRGEQEFLYLPCSFIQRTRPGTSRIQLLDGGLVTFVDVKVNLNIRTQTVEELQHQKKSMHLVSAKSIEQEVSVELTEWISSKLQQGIDLKHYVGDVVKFKDGFLSTCKEVIRRHENESTPEDYADDEIYRQMITDVLDLKGNAIETTRWQEKRMQLTDHDFRSAKLGATLHGHTNYVQAVAFHQTKPILASCSKDRDVKLWHFKSDASEATNVLTWKAHDQCVNCVAFDPSATILASGSEDESVKLWLLDPEKWGAKCVANLRGKKSKGHKDWVNSVAFHPTEHILASGSSDSTVKLWLLNYDSWKECKCLDTLSGHDGGVLSVAFHPTEPFLASASEDKTVKLWRLAKGNRSAKCVATLEGHGYEDSVACDSENGSEGDDGEDNAAEDVVDGDDDDDEEEDDENKDNEEEDEEECYVNAVAFHPTEPILASGSHDTTVRLWRFSFDITGPQDACCFAILRGHSDHVLSVAFHPTLPILASGGCEDDKTARLWLLGEDSAKCYRTLRGHSDSVQSVTFHPTAPVLATGSADNSTKFWR